MWEEKEVTDYRLKENMCVCVCVRVLLVISCPPALLIVSLCSVCHGHETWVVGVRHGLPPPTRTPQVYVSP